MRYNSVLVTGGLGQVGSYLGERLVSLGVDVTILDNMSSKSSHHVKNAKFTRGDIRDRELVNRMVKEVDAVVHCAAQISIASSLDDPHFDADNNINGTLNLLNAACNSNIKRFVYFSSAAVYGYPIRMPVDESHPQDPINPYGVSKLSGEKYAMALNKLYGLPTTAIRPFNIYSCRQDPSNSYAGVIPRFIERVSAGKPPIIYGDGMQTRDFVSVQDVVGMVLLMMEKQAAIGKVFNCGTGSMTSINEVARIVIELFGNDKIEPEFQPACLGDGRCSCADISLARNVLGYSPSISLKEGIKEIVGQKIENRPIELMRPVTI